MNLINLCYSTFFFFFENTQPRLFFWSMAKQQKGIRTWTHLSLGFSLKNPSAVWGLSPGFSLVRRHHWRSGLPLASPASLVAAGWELVDVALGGVSSVGFASGCKEALGWVVSMEGSGFLHCVIGWMVWGAVLRWSDVVELRWWSA